jgi:dihydroflavonol-4-reductase
MADRVLVTGGTGFIARWCIVELLRRGHHVRTTVRDDRRSESVRAAVGSAVDPGDRLRCVVADLTADAGWADAVAGCTAVLHVASPLAPDDPRDPEAMVAVAVGGTTRVLRAAIEAGVERVVMTSAANTASPTSYTEDGVTDETLWTDPDAPGLPAYRRSKTLAERAAWDVMADVDGPTTLSTVLPGAVFGPVLAADNLGSVDVVGRLLRGEVPAIPRIGLEVVDVRDLVDVHLRAMTSPAAAGERFLATGQFAWMGEIAAALREGLPPGAASKVPTDVAPDDVVRELARQRPELAGILPGLGRRNRHSTAKAERLLGWTSRPAAESVLDCARSLIDHGVA